MNNITGSKWLQNTSDYFVDKFGQHGPKVGFMVAAVVGTATVADLIMDGQDSRRAKSQQLKQERRVRKQQDEMKNTRMEQAIRQRQAEEMAQTMLANRTGHSNTWGGRRY